ncbi:hypothetical protein [Nonomuraea sp. GTA35]|uniref:hypothetical protein n=1 Tax=Nonomuraea sp. GTA35 TaxID=1676746 RepID=UPI0035BF9938
MTGFLSELGKKLAERWVALLALPGLLYVAAALAATALGWPHALDVAELGRRIEMWAREPALGSVGGSVLVVGTILMGSVAAGLAAVALGRLTEILWELPGRQRPARWLADMRRRRSIRAKQAADSAQTAEEIARAVARADRLCLVEADRPTWIGDRLRACRIRVERSYGLNLDVVWPRLWLTLPDQVRAELTTARDAYGRAARLFGWAVLYLVLALWWWPAVLIAAGTACTAWSSARTATTVLTELIEGAVDLYGPPMLAQLQDVSLTREQGAALTSRLRRSRWDPDSPLGE